MPYVYDTFCPSCDQASRADELCRFCWTLVPNPRACDEEETTDAPACDADQDDERDTDLDTVLAPDIGGSD